MSQYLIDQIEGDVQHPGGDAHADHALLGDGHLECIDVEGAGGNADCARQVRCLSLSARRRRRTGCLSGFADDARVSAGWTGPEAGAGVEWPPDREPYLLETSVPGIFVAGDVRFTR